MSRIALALGLVTILSLLVIWFVLHQFLNQDDIAWKSAQRFCASLQIGSSAHDIADRSKRAGADLWSWARDAEGRTKHVAWFGGFLSNEHTCNIAEKNGVIEARWAEEHRF